MNQIPNIEETHNTREVEEWEREFVEHGASLEHERWANWQNYLHSKLTFNGKDWVLPNELYERWQRQIHTPYADLSEAEKESDRKEARTYLPLVHQQLQKAREDGYNAGLADDDDDIPPLPKGKTLDDLIKDVWVDHSELDHQPDRPLNSERD